MSVVVRPVPTTTSRGAELFWETTGSGPRLMFCNGSTMTVESGRPLLEMAGQGFELLSWDYRGLGRSAAVAAPYTMADLAADAVAVLDDAGWEACAVMGLSFGGMVAQEIAVHLHPERVQRLALACTSPGGAGGSSYPLEHLAELDGTERTTTWRKLLDERWDEEWLAEHAIDMTLAGSSQSRPIATARTPTGAEGRRLQMQARSGFDAFERLGAISSPTLVGDGRYDGIAPPANSSAMASRIRGVRAAGL